MKTIFAMILGLFFVGASYALAQKAQTKASLLVATTAIEAGKSFDVGIRLQMPAGWHTYSKNAGDSGMPTEVVWELPPGFHASELRWPKPMKFETPPLITFGYEGEVVLLATITPPATLSQKSIELKADVAWLECKEICVPGQAIIQRTMSVGKSEASSEAGLIQKFEGLVTNEGAGDPQKNLNETPVAAESKSVGLILLFAFIGGLILNLMPCVLPVLSLKILGFVREAQQEGSQVWKQGVSFTAGVLISFWILTGLLLLLRVGGQEIGWGFQLQSPGFVLGMAILFLVMTLNLFGLFEIGTSLASLENQIYEKQGWLKSFGSGVLATLVATPCSAPFMGVAVGYALGQSAGLTFFVMTFLALGVAAPYLILSFNPHWMKKIPKPGDWMIRFKYFLGFLMMGALFWLIWVYAQLQGISGLASILILVGLLSFAIWGFTQFQSRWVRFVCVALGILGLYQSVPNQTQVKWEPFSTARLEALRKEGKPVFIDFTAAWCLSCQVNKKLVLHRQEIEEAFQKRGITLLEADWTNRDPEITKALTAYGRASVPLYVFYTGNPEEAPILLPEVLTIETVLKELEKIPLK